MRIRSEKMYELKHAKLLTFVNDQLINIELVLVPTRVASSTSDTKVRSKVPGFIEEFHYLKFTHTRIRHDKSSHCSGKNGNDIAISSWDPWHL